MGPIGRRRRWVERGKIGVEQPEFRGQGLGTWLMECVMEHPDLQGLRRLSLVTRDAHELYRPFGFTEVGSPERHMEIVRPGLYKEKG